MDLWKFFDLIQRRALYFVRRKKLLAEDPYEGAAVLVPPKGEGARDGLDTLTEKCRNGAFVNCWHLGEPASMLMWKVYGGAGDGVAIQSTCGKLRECLARTTDFAIRVCRIRYEGFGIYEETPPWIEYDCAIAKRKLFEDERELRALFLTKKVPAWQSGCHIPVEVQKLVDKIHLGPLCSDWGRARVKPVVLEHGLSVPVIWSYPNDIR